MDYPWRATTILSRATAKCVEICMGDAPDCPAFSRTGDSCALGKATEEVKCLVPEAVKEHFTAVAVMHGKSTSEYMRDLLISHLYGEFRAARMKVSGRAGFDEGQESAR